MKRRWRLLWSGTLFALACGATLWALRSSTAPIPVALSDMEGLMSTSHTAANDDPKKVATFRNVVQPYLERGVEIPESVFEQAYDGYGPQLMIDVLDQDRTCHVAAHNLGRVIYTHTGDLVDSLAICQSKCTEGCIHGALMEMFHSPLSADDPDPEAMTPELEQKIAATCESGPLLTYMNRANCYHALGHVIDALAENDTRKATSLCDSIFKTISPSAAYFCATGVYMQQSLVVGGVPRFTKNGFTPCDTSEYPAACYRYYMGAVFPGALYDGAVAFCGTLSGAQRLGCFSGVGANWYPQVHADPRALNSMCGSGSDDDKRVCLEGALELLNVYYRGTALQSCAYYNAGSRALCEEAAKYQHLDMRRDLSLYLP